MKRKWKYWAICAAIAVIGAAGARLLSNYSFFQNLNLKALDLHFVVRGQLPAASSNIVLVTINQAALDKFPDPLIFFHQYYADAISAAAEGGAKVVGLDAAFGIPVDKWVPDYDRMLAGAVASAPIPVIVGYVTALNTKQQERPIQVNMLAAALGLAAYANLTDDPDGFIRKQELIERPPKSPNDPPPSRNLAMRVAEKYVGSDATFENGRLIFNGHPVPGSDRTITINYAGPPGTFPRVSIVDFLDAAKAGRKQQLRDWVSGKAVMIGLDMVQDRFPTPFYTLSSGIDRLTAGVEIHASTLRTLLERRYILPVPEWSRIAALLTVASATVLLATMLAAGPAAGWLVFELALILIGTHFLFRAGLILSTSEILNAAGICLIGSIVYRFSTAEKRGALYHKAVSLFVGRELASALDTKESIELSGKQLDVTILFTDIRGFTAFSEQLCQEQGPAALVKLLNEYMGQMVSIIVRHHGHVNKFIGDGILAIFSDDDPGAVKGDHPIRAVACATEMVSAPSQFSTGAGIHTGTAIVGNVGSADKMEYTVLGDTVNLASRLESLNKEHHTKLLMSGTTQTQLKDQVETVHLAAVPVRGKKEPINLFTVASLVPAPEAAVHA